MKVARNGIDGVSLDLLVIFIRDAPPLYIIKHVKGKAYLAGDRYAIRHCT